VRVVVGNVVEDEAVDGLATESFEHPGEARDDARLGSGFLFGSLGEASDVPAHINEEMPHKAPSPPAWEW
jgi:hypothetical protein